MGIEQYIYVESCETFCMPRPDGHLPARVISGMRVTLPDEFQEQLEEGDRVWISAKPMDAGEEIPYSHAADVARLRED